tara:strand:+ start:7682 stop:8143 length:462 start_codon:yes stop_codon:yes gene_type:complete
MAKNGYSMSNRVDVETLTADKTLTASDCGKTIILNVATGLVVTLPSSPADAGAGWNVTFLIGTDLTGLNLYLINGTAGADFFIGSLQSISTTKGEVLSFPANGSSHNGIEINATTKGGHVGTRINFISDGTDWHISGVLACTGTPDSPFEAIV